MDGSPPSRSSPLDLPTARAAGPSHALGAATGSGGAGKAPGRPGTRPCGGAEPAVSLKGAGRWSRGRGPTRGRRGDLHRIGWWRRRLASLAGHQMPALKQRVRGCRPGSVAACRPWHSAIAARAGFDRNSYRRAPEPPGYSRAAPGHWRSVPGGGNTRNRSTPGVIMMSRSASLATRPRTRAQCLGELLPGHLGMRTGHTACEQLCRPGHDAEQLAGAVMVVRSCPRLSRNTWRVTIGGSVSSSRPGR